MTLLNTVRCFVSNISDLNNVQETEILLYGKENLDDINNTSILNATINLIQMGEEGKKAPLPVFPL